MLPVPLLLVLLLGLPTRVQSAVSQRPGELWHALTVPGGTAELARVAGLTDAIEPSQIVLEIVRRWYYGVDPQSSEPDAIVSHLEQARFAAGASGSGVTTEVIPLPLDPAVWSSTILEKKVEPADLLAAILADRRAAWLYHGLSALDRDTLGFFAARPDLLRRLREHAGTFAAFGRSLVVRNGRVELPAGTPAPELWTSLVGEPAASTDRFILGLLARDDGRLAYFYDTISHLDAAHRRFAYGDWIADRDRRARRFNALYDVFRHSNQHWVIPRGPFWRPDNDPSLVLRTVGVDESGRLRAPAAPELWDAVLSGRRLPKSPGVDATGDAAWLLDTICLAPVTQRRDRFEAWLFAERLFGGVPAREWPDLVTALRGFLSHRALALTLERMDIASPALHARAVRRAIALAEIGDPDRAAVARTLFQGSIALVARARQARTLDPAGAARLVESLAGVEPDREGRYGSALAAWIEGELLPRLKNGRDDLGTAEHVLMAGLSGTSRGGLDGSVEPQLVEWEEHTYRVAPAEGELRRLLRIRERQGGAWLDDALDLVRGARSLGGQPVDPAATETLGRAAARVGPFAFAPGGERHDPPGLVSAVLAAATRPVPAGSSADGTRAVQSLVDLAATVLADVVRSIVYACSLGDPDGAALLGSNVARRHQFGLTAIDPTRRQLAAWVLPYEESGYGGPWRVRGSLLGLDIGLSRLALRRLGTGTGRRPVLNENDRRGYAENVALMNPLDLGAADLDRLVRAVRRGRELVADLARDPDRAVRVADLAGLSEWRRNLLVWTARHAPDRVARSMSLTELLWLGAADLDVPLPPHPWGASQYRAAGCLCLAFPAPGPWEDHSGQRAGGVLATRLLDLHIRVAEALADFRLPATLLRDILRAATQDFIDEVDPADPNDWWPLTRRAEALSTSRLEDYIASLVTDGSLVPVEPPAAVGR